MQNVHLLSCIEQMIPVLLKRGVLPSVVRLTMGQDDSRHCVPRGYSKSKVITCRHVKMEGAEGL